jgi:hypothetical protein
MRLIVLAIVLLLGAAASAHADDGWPAGMTLDQKIKWLELTDMKYSPDWCDLQQKKLHLKHRRKVCGPPE